MDRKVQPKLIYSTIYKYIIMYFDILLYFILIVRLLVMKLYTRQANGVNGWIQIKWSINILR